MNEMYDPIIKQRFFYEIIVAFELFLMALLAPIGLNILKKISSEPIYSDQIGSLALGVSLFTIVVLLDIFVAWGLMKLFISDQRMLSIISMIFRVIYAILLLFSLTVFMKIGNEKSFENYKTVFNIFNKNWNNALLIFGIHLILIGIAIIRSKYLSGILGLLVIISGFGYMFDTIIKVFIPNTTMAISIFTFIGEVLLIFWLPINVIRTKKLIKRQETGST